MAQLSRVTCPKGHTFSRRVTDLNKGENVRTTCPECRKRYFKNELTISEMPEVIEPEPVTVEQVQDKEPEPEEKTELSVVSTFNEPALKVETAASLKADSGLSPKPQEERVSNQVKEPLKDAFTKKQIEAFCDLLFSMLAAKRGKHWMLSPEEKEALVPPLTRLANKYLGGKFGKFSDEIAVAIAVGMIFITRIMQDKAEKAKASSSTSGLPPSIPTPVLEAKPLPTTEELQREYPGLI